MLHVDLGHTRIEILLRLVDVLVAYGRVGLADAHHDLVHLVHLLLGQIKLFLTFLIFYLFHDLTLPVVEVLYKLEIN